MDGLRIDDKFLEQYRDLISKYIWSKTLEGREEYDNIYNDVVIKLMESVDKYDPKRGALTTWITWVMRTVVFNYFRDKQVDALHNALPLLDEQIAGYDQSQDPADMEDIVDIITKVKDLTPFEKLMLLDYYHFGYTAREVGERRDMSEAAAEVRIHRAKQKLIAQVQGELTGSAERTGNAATQRRIKDTEALYQTNQRQPTGLDNGTLSEAGGLRSIPSGCR